MGKINAYPKSNGNTRSRSRYIFPLLFAVSGILMYSVGSCNIFRKHSLKARLYGNYQMKAMFSFVYSKKYIDKVILMLYTSNVEIFDMKSIQESKYYMELF